MISFPRCGVLAIASLLAGCSFPAGPLASRQPEGDSPEAHWERQVAPFDVVDQEGVPYELPFLGGFNVPRPQLVDIDRDGDQDLFIQEDTDRLLFFEREDTAQGATYRWVPERFEELRIGEWYRFVDVDEDGDQDLLSESPFSYMRLFQNVGTGDRPTYELAVDTLRDNRGEPIFSDRQNIPNAMDIDCNGMLDLLIGRLVGTVTRYEAAGGARGGVSRFEHVTDRFQNIEIVGDPAASPGGVAPARTFEPLSRGPAPLLDGVPMVRHGANTMTLADVDADGDVDFFWGDFFEPGLLFIENTGTCADPNLVGEPRPFPVRDPIETSGYNAPAFGDTDGDGDLDLVIGVLGGAYNPQTTTIDNLLHLTQSVDGEFQLQTRRLISQIDVGSESVASLVDLDGDGDLDLLVGNRIDPQDLEMSRLYRFDNVGSATAPSFQMSGTLDIDGAYHNAPAFGDLDGDGDLDMLLGTWRSELRYFENAGSRTAPEFALIDPALVELTRGSNATPTLGDIDGDDDMDLIVGESAGTLSLYINSGTEGAASFELISDRYLDLDIGRRSFPTLADFDDDGDLDLAIGTERDGIAYLENQGSPFLPNFVLSTSPFPAASDLPLLVTPSFGDLDGDGDLEMVAGGAGGGAHYFHHR